MLLQQLPKPYFYKLCFLGRVKIPEKKFPGTGRSCLNDHPSGLVETTPYNHSYYYWYFFTFFVPCVWSGEDSFYFGTVKARSGWFFSLPHHFIIITSCCHHSLLII